MDKARALSFFILQVKHVCCAYGHLHRIFFLRRPDKWHFVCRRLLKRGGNTLCLKSQPMLLLIVRAGSCSATLAAAVASAPGTLV